MVDPINLNRVRKTKAREAARSKATENRVAFGRTKAERDLEKARADKALRELEAKKRD